MSSSITGSPIGSQIDCLLVANRGEIARRILRTCRAAGIATVAVHSDPDADAPHVREADAAVRLPGRTPGETYLRFDLLVEAARRTGADAVHPGYGFGAESAAFARAVLAAGLIWVGPGPDAIEAMASKVEAKRLMAVAGVPVLRRLDPRSVSDADLPVLVKASTGGGGRGMRVVRSRADLAGALASAEAEARSAFGDGTVFCEPYLPGVHHVEVQILADRHGTVWAMGDRECSIQRRHQKIIEESPSPLVERTTGMRERLFAAAVDAARAVSYQGAGTVEFLADEEGRFHFLEMNTRLQVEHPVTEAVTGVDLVLAQLQVAEGRRLAPEPPAARGWAVEARLVAEDPAAGWQPTSGVIHRLHVPGVASTFAGTAGAGLRLDRGIDDGEAVTVHYDPLLAKVIATAPERLDAVRALAAALARAEIHGVRTNRDLLVRVLRHEEFRAGRTDTGFLDRHQPDGLFRPLAGPEAEQLSALAAALADAARDRAGAPVQAGLPAGWRNVVSALQRRGYTGPGGTHAVEYRLTRDGLLAPAHPGVRLLALAADAVTLEVDGVRRAFTVRSYPAEPGAVYVDSPLGAVSLVRVERFPRPADLLDPGSLVAPMPGVVVAVLAGVGDALDEGQPLLVLEAMKMQHTVRVPAGGRLAALHVADGCQVDAGTVLAVVSARSAESGPPGEETEG